MCEEAKFCIIFLLHDVPTGRVSNFSCSNNKIPYIGRRSTFLLSLIRSILFFVCLYLFFGGGLFNFLCWSSQYLFYIFYCYCNDTSFFWWVGICLNDAASCSQKGDRENVRSQTFSRAHFCPRKRWREREAHSQASQRKMVLLRTHLLWRWIMKFTFLDSEKMFAQVFFPPRSCTRESFRFALIKGF